MICIYFSGDDDQEDGTLNKINAAYSYGGPEGALSVLNKNLDMDIEHYLYDVVGFKESETYWMEFKGVIKNLTLTDYSI